MITTDPIDELPTPSDNNSILYAESINVVETPGYGYLEYRTTSGITIPDGMLGMVFPLDTICDTGLILATGVTILPSGTYTPITLKFKYVKNTIKYEIGDAIGKVIIFGAAANNSSTISKDE